MNHRRRGRKQELEGSVDIGIPRHKVSGLVTVGRLGVVSAVILSAIAVGVANGAAQESSAKAKTAVSIALDWTPNADNEGVFVAQKLGYFAAAGLSVTIVPYGKTAPDTLVASGRTNFAIAATEGDALEDFAQGDPVTSVMTIVQRDPTVLVYLANTKRVTSPAYFCGKTNGGPGDPSEYAEVQTMLDTAAGHHCAYKNVVLGSDAAVAIAAHKIDFSILFYSDVIQAKAEGISLGGFSPQKYGMPQNYGPVVLGNDSFLAAHKAVAKAFVQAVAKGFSYVQKNPVNGAAILYEMNPNASTKAADTTETVAEAKSYLLSPSGKIGVQSLATWKSYGAWEIKRNLLTNGSGHPIKSLNYTAHVTNAYL